MGKIKRKPFTVDDLKQRLAANPALRAENPGFSLPATTPGTATVRQSLPLLPPSKGQDSAPGKKKGKKRGEMNKTEAEFALMLRQWRDQGKIQSFAYEAITLRFGEGKTRIAYTPDFFCVDAADYVTVPAPITFREVKGGHIRTQDLLRFKATKTHFANQFRFELWQKKDRQWKQLI